MTRWTKRRGGGGPVRAEGAAQGRCPICLEELNEAPVQASEEEQQICRCFWQENHGESMKSHGMPWFWLLSPCFPKFDVHSHW